MQSSLDQVSVFIIFEYSLLLSSASATASQQPDPTNNNCENNDDIALIMGSIHPHQKISTILQIRAKQFVYNLIVILATIADQARNYIHKEAIHLIIMRVMPDFRQ